VNLALAIPARLRAADFELSGCAQALQRGLAEAAAYAPTDALSVLGAGYRESEEALLYWTGPYVLDEILHELVEARASSGLPLAAREMRVAVRRARQHALETYPEWRWPRRVVAALTLAYLVGAALRRAAAIRRMDADDPLTGTYLKLIETRSAWMPT
jgi:hypothetical protein